MKLRDCLSNLSFLFFSFLVILLVIVQKKKKKKKRNDEIDPNIRDADDMTPLHHAAVNGHFKCVTRLMECTRLNPNQKNSNGLTALFLACEKVSHGNKQYNTNTLASCMLTKP